MSTEEKIALSIVSFLAGCLLALVAICLGLAAS